MEVTISFSPLHYLIYSNFFLVQPNTIYFCIWLRISVKIKILLVRNALLSLVSLYTVYQEMPNILLIQISRFSTHIVE